MSSVSPRPDLQNLLSAAGDKLIEAYRDQVRGSIVTARVIEEKLTPKWQYFPVAIVQALPQYYSIENAHQWVRFDKFNKFLQDKLQTDSPSKPVTPQKRVRSSSDASVELLSSPLATCNAAKRLHVEIAPSSKPRKGSADASAIIISSDTSSYTPSSPLISSNRQNKVITRQTKTSMGSDDATSSTVVSKPSRPAKKSRSQRNKSISAKDEREAAGWIQITKMTWVKQLITITELRENWPVPADPNEPVAYLVDLSRNGIDYRDDKGNLWSMANIIKNAVIFPSLPFIQTSVTKYSI